MKNIGVTDMQSPVIESFWGAKSEIPYLHKNLYCFVWDVLHVAFNFQYSILTRFIVNIKGEIFPFPWFSELHFPIKNEQPVLEITVCHWTLSYQILIIITSSHTMSRHFTNTFCLFSSKLLFIHKIELDALFRDLNWYQ